jgi:hypothetical protein
MARILSLVVFDQFACQRIVNDATHLAVDFEAASLMLLVFATDRPEISALIFGIDHSSSASHAA